MARKPSDMKRAVAMVYNPDEAGAPRVIAKGAGISAEAMISLAREHGVYVHQSPELVSMLMQVDLDAEIPPELYQAVAELLAWLYQMDERLAGMRTEHL
ncbi:EscU/YscU/HrcU family type III secretion system export apparatus switch protein [Geomonas oryzae]|uniref:EscU/YscU/HrcU family type III secretion system export apparatus switch protein n=1 Tax=Geomonas oryzae TaxID=2364273 RepID=UPI00100AB7FD|nr:EscU/YscU/HrcU family type III secretion system export apparatus switch protein [Geomonas oryzae]